jgi:hypothetical protein
MGVVMAVVAIVAIFGLTRGAHVPDPEPQRQQM